jgi:pimeloyl-ACP methyl ester carboxylesterase
MADVRAGDGLLLYAEAHGAGTPLVFSCPLHTTHENWRPQVAPLAAAGFRVVLWDYRGHGRSEAPDDPARYDMDRVVDDLGRVLDWAAPGEPAVLAGLSFGGLASLHFALRQPGRVRALVLIDTGPGFKNPEAQARWTESVERTAAFLEREGMGRVVAGRSAELAVGTSGSPAARAALAAIAAQDPRGLAHFGRRVAGPAPPVIDRLGEIRAPALVIVGEHDAAYHRASQVLAARIPGAQSVTLQGAGHVVNLDAPEAFEAAILRFLRALPARAA